MRIIYIYIIVSANKVWCQSLVHPVLLMDESYFHKNNDRRVLSILNNRRVLSILNHIIYIWTVPRCAICTEEIWHTRIFEKYYQFTRSSMHICVGKITIIVSDNVLSPGRRQAIIWTNAWILLIRTLGTNFSEILIKKLIHFHWRKCI